LQFLFKTEIGFTYRQESILAGRLQQDLVHSQRTKRRLGLKKFECGGLESCNFPTDGCKFPIQEIVDAQNFNFATEFSLNWKFPATNFVFLDQSFPTRRKS